jgi:Tat protein secretion system quality control protein TatD with DNase activity
VLHVADKLAEVINIPVKDVTKITTQNAAKLFNLNI